MTTLPSVPTKVELLKALRSSGDEVVERVGSVPSQRMEEGRYENGWNARQILAHVASIEWTYPRLIDVAREAKTPRANQPAAGQPSGQTNAASEAPTRTARGGILSYNDRQVEKRDGATVQELLEEFKTNRAATIAAIEALDDELLLQEIKSAGGVTGPLAGVINAVAVLHIRAHVKDIVG